MAEGDGLLNVDQSVLAIFGFPRKSFSFFHFTERANWAGVGLGQAVLPRRRDIVGTLPQRRTETGNETGGTKLKPRAHFVEEEGAGARLHGHISLSALRELVEKEIYGGNPSSLAMMGISVPA